MNQSGNLGAIQEKRRETEVKNHGKNERSGRRLPKRGKVFAHEKKEARVLPAKEPLEKKHRNVAQFRQREFVPEGKLLRLQRGGRV